MVSLYWDAIDNHSHLHLHYVSPDTNRNLIPSTMYVCLCHSVTEDDIREAASSGATDLRALAEQTGCATGCGCCAEWATEVLSETLRPKEAFLPQVVHA